MQFGHDNGPVTCVAGPLDFIKKRCRCLEVSRLIPVSEGGADGAGNLHDLTIDRHKPLLGD